MRKHLLILLCLVFISGCGNLKSSWGNFRAYYNTFYNAEKNFKSGLQKVQNQPNEIDATEPVRVHRSPVQAGNSDFQNAIDKGATILRKFPTSKWADDALLLIGKSYYYRQEFFPALQKFEELRNATSVPAMEQLAIIWKGRTQLDLKQYSQGASFLESELNQYPPNWSGIQKAEIQVLAAEHHAMQQQWSQSAELLAQAVSEIENRKLLGRSLFLYGQVLERLERYGEAYYAFSKVPENFPGFEYTYWARYKQADVARKEGNLQLAIDIYERLRKDDKNFQRRGELNFEIARTREMQGNLAEAEQQYKTLLHGDKNQQTQDLRADIYYRLGKLYSDKYNNFSLAAAYFDSASAINDAPEKVEVSQDPQALADAFGKFTRLQRTVTRADSLLQLGRLSSVELDSALQQIRAQKRRELLAEREAEQQNTLANREVAESGGQEAAKSAYGFLNHRNPELANRSKTEFQIVWGNRPLIDNWRRMEVVRQSSVSRTTANADQQNQRGQQAQATTVEMNLEDIPRTPERRQKLESEKVMAQYELGNVLFLNLNSPDKARQYFYRVIDNPAAQELRPRAMYSLYELFNTQGNTDSVAVWKERILEEYPDTRYAQRISSGAGITTPIDTTQQIAAEFQELMASADSNKALKLRKLALKHQATDVASQIFYEAIKAYIRQAKANDQQQDSLAKLIQPNISEVLGTRDSTARELPVEPMPEQQFRGAYWDSTRSAIQQFDTTFTSAKEQGRVATLREMLKQPEKNMEIPSCQRLGISLSVTPSMDSFLSTVTYPKELKDTSLSGKVVYTFIVDGQGAIQSYELVSQRTSLGIEDAFEDAFDQSLKFAPLEFDNPPDRIRCEVSFPIDH